MKSFPKFHIIC